MASPSTTEFGDFQTPILLAEQVCQLIGERGLAPKAVIEPTCGIGNFLLATLDHFPTVNQALGMEINKAYVAQLISTLRMRPYAGKVHLIQENFFHADLPTLLQDLPEPILAIGNPPWVTNAQLGVLGSSNLPHKKNFQNYNGLDALTGKSNFDISEWILIKLVESLKGRRATLAMLCKSAVARKVLAYIWKNRISVENAAIYDIDAGKFFNAAVDACLFICSLARAGDRQECLVFQHIEDRKPVQTIGWQNGQLLADLTAYNRWKHLEGEENYKWRSGIKHDCAKIMEFRQEGNQYANGLGEIVDLEDDYLYPMVKASEIANQCTKTRNRRMLVTQTAVGENTHSIRVRAPKTWEYLQKHGKTLDCRASSIYRNRPRFSVFGVGSYSFSPWKVAISGFHKKFQFTVIGSTAGKPTVLDDTTSFVSCQTEAEAQYIASLLNSDPAKNFFSAFVFWDTKRPITIDILRRLNLLALARELRTETTLASFLAQKNLGRSNSQLDLFGIQ